ncbi:hypothetical protein DMB66_56345 [Actinoplanes sp. ATCC 53533]|uniref:hypothetical protein n=1 Tax=Actinoplanes sp. ATCC 53533 TaxID=1288362 RepID=UPI000F79270F|nr:hypothetical protein [Actinoplanes sp. ATCC 53533]RSM41274.1 hypothetical protein DMB66_56345 [Actinoplanes sp. ATCC 53533]
MPNTLRTAGLAVLAAGVLAAIAVALATPITAGITEALRSGHTSVSPVAAWPAQASLALTGRLDQILRLVRCPTIINGTQSVR